MPPPPPPFVGPVLPATPSTDPKTMAISVPVVFGTNRVPLPRGVGMKQEFGIKRGALIYGLAQVSVPSRRDSGEIPTTPAIYARFGMPGNPRTEFILMHADPIQPEEIGRITASFFRYIPGQRRGLVFVHGYNVSFESAAFRAAQLSVDMKLERMPVFFSWASKAGLAAYWKDENTALQSVPDFKRFLKTYLDESKVDQLVIIAHSMGSRIVTSGLVEMLQAVSTIAKKLNHLVLAAPDLDGAVFTEQVMPVLLSSRIPVTIYASSNDKALLASVKMHGFTRVGSAGKDIVVGDGMETIDVSAIPTDSLGHSTFGASPRLLDDIRALVEEGRRAPARAKLSPRPNLGAPRYWMMEK